MILENTKSIISKVAEKLNLPREALNILLSTEREVKVNFPVKMDDGTQKLFTGYRIQHNSLLGPYKGGIRYHPEINLDEVTALAIWMTIKTATMNLPLGGGKGGVICNPKELSEKEIENLTRAFTKKIAPVIGPQKDIPAPDVYTNSKIMDIIVDEYSKTENLPIEKARAVVTGKSLENGGSLGRDNATARGGQFALKQAIEQTKIIPTLENATVAIQGIGNAGSNFAKLITEDKSRIKNPYLSFDKSQDKSRLIALSDSKGAIYNQEGLNLNEVLEHKKQTGSLIDFPNATNITNEQLLELDCDILVPAALANQITKENANQIKAKIILELANGPTTPEADEILEGKGKLILPDILANAGGVTVSYYEWYQNLNEEKWTAEEVDKKLKEKMQKATKEILDKKEKYQTTTRIAAYINAIERLSEKLI